MKEFADFLGGQSPYDLLTGDELERLARAVEVEFFRRRSTIVAAGGPALDHLWVVRTGTVEVLVDGRLVDLLGEGDTFGHDSLLSGLPPSLSVRAAEDALCYRLPDPRSVLARPERLRFTPYGSVVGRRRFAAAAGAGGLPDRAQLPVGRFARPLVRCAPDTPLREVARCVDEARGSCAIVDFPDGPGIVTDADFRRHVGTGLVGADAPVAQIATRPVHAVGAGVAVAQAYAEMLTHHVHHLLVTDEAGRPSGVVRVVDLASAEVRDPLVVRAAVEGARDVAELAAACGLLPSTAIELADAAVPALRIGALLAAVLDAVLRRLLQLTWPADVTDDTSWFALGSLARREVLPGSDVDTALVWTGDGRTGDRVLAAAGRVLADLRRCGLETCADGANADDPRFARSITDWQAAVDRWLRDPGSTSDALLLSTMLADGRPLTGLPLGRTVTGRLLRASAGPQFRRLLLQYTLSSRPPTGFVRDFVVEHSGEHRGRLDLKGGGLRPVTSIGRWVAVVTGDADGGTPDRLRRAVDADLLTRDESDTLIAAHAQIFGLLLDHEISALRSGTPADTYLAPATLDSLTRRHLRESFRAIAHVQGRLESIWTDRAGR